MTATYPADDPRALAAAYFAAWKAHDPGALRALLADDATFAGPLGTAGNADEMATAIQGLFAITTDVVVQVMAADGGDVVTWFDLHTTVARQRRSRTGARSATGRSSASAPPSIPGPSSRGNQAE